MKMDMSKQHLVGIFIIMFCAVCHSYPGCSKSWDYLTFRQQWAPTFCIEHDCHVKETVKTWTVHGLWPSQTGNKHCPRYCNRTFNPSDIQGIKGELNKYWPDLFPGEEDKFWRDEWEKHGSCAVTLPALDSELNYFSRAIKLNREYDVLEQLRSHGVTAGSTPYHVDQLVNALQVFGNPNLGCYYSEGKKYILSVEICFDKNFHVETCESFSHMEQNSLYGSKPCDSDEEPVYYPELKYRGIMY